MEREGASQNVDPRSVELQKLREKYREERDKRLRADAEAQYIEAKGQYAHFNDFDPYAEGFSREPLGDEIDVAIIGAGFSGLMTAAHLLQHKVDDIRIIEAGGDFGGTWYWNRYPGAQCDIEGYIYLPLLEETGYIPIEKYSFAAEILEHCKRVGLHYGLYEKTCFQTRVTDIAWNETTRRWLIRTNRKDAIKARFVVTCSGSGARPKLPGIPGIERFRGSCFHTSRWDYKFTGGDPNARRWEYQTSDANNTGKLDKLSDKSVALIGTGATGLQCMPYLARDARQLYVFQRTPSAVSLRGGNPPTDPQWAKTLRAGWQRERRENFESVMQGKPVDIDLVNDCWTQMFRNMLAAVKPGLSPAETAYESELADQQMMNQVRDQISSLVKDSKVAEMLKPWYRPRCKRPAYNDEYLSSFNRPNVTLVDVSTSKGVEKITPDGVVANGVEHAVDCIIFATGFEITIMDFKRGIGFDILGRDGASLYDHWADGPRTLHGHSTHGFPNWFYIGMSQNAMGFNQGYMLNEQALHIAYIIGQAIVRNAETVEATAEAEAQWVARIHELARFNREYLLACTPGYYNNEGALRGGGILSEIYSPGISAFHELLTQWREDGKLAGLRLTRQDQS